MASELNINSHDAFGSSTVVIGTSGAQSAASTALEADSKIPPTIRVPLGTPLQVFVARDLDFSR